MMISLLRAVCPKKLSEIYVIYILRFSFSKL
jgi:hypothetical protein